MSELIKIGVVGGAFAALGWVAWSLFSKKSVGINGLSKIPPEVAKGKVWDGRPWDRQRFWPEEETEEEYQAFVAYLMCGSLSKAYTHWWNNIRIESVGPGEEVQKRAPSRWCKWSSKNLWVERRKDWMRFRASFPVDANEQWEKMLNILERQA